MRALDAFGHALGDLRLAARALRRAPGFIGVVVASLGLGLALAASTLAVVNAYLIRSLPYPAADRLYHVRYAPPGPVEPGGMSALDWTSVADVVEFPVTTVGETYYVTGDAYSQTARGLRVSTGFMSALGVRTTLGRLFDRQDFDAVSEPVALIGFALWRDRFARDTTVVGRVIRVEREAGGGEPELLRIVGVLSPGFWFGRNSDDGVDILVPLGSPARTYMARLQESVPPALAARRLTEAARRVATSLPPDWSGVQLESVRERYVSELRPVAISIAVAAGLVLVVVCVNVAVLVLLRAMRRQKEVAIRVALGAGRRHILRLLLAEATLLCAGALALGLGLTVLTLELLAPLIEEQLGRPAPGGSDAIAVDSTVLLVLGGLGAVIALSLSGVPLLARRQERIADSLRAADRAGSDGPTMRRVRSSLIALEVAGSLALLVGAGLLLRSVVGMVRTDLGFRTEELVRVGVVFPGRSYPDAPARSAFYERLVQRVSPLSSMPPVMTSWPPFAETPAYPVMVEGSSESAAGAGVINVGAGYFTLLGIPLRQGREFTALDRAGAPPVAIISATLARRLWPDGSAVGRRIRVVDEPGTATPSQVWRSVVGVAADVRQTYRDQDLHDVYLSHHQATPERFGSFYLRTPRPPAELLGSLRTALVETDPLATIRGAVAVGTLDRELARMTFLTSLLTGFALFAALLALIGMYGVIAYAVRQREREVAIRMAVGATRAVVVRLFLREGGALLAIGVGLGWLGAVGLARLLGAQLLGVQKLDPWSFAGASLLMTCAGLLAIWWPARRAADTDPMVVLKQN